MQGDDRAYCGLSEIHHDGYGVPAETDAAVAWCARAAITGLEGAERRSQELPGDRLDEGPGPHRNA